MIKIIIILIIAFFSCNCKKDEELSFQKKINFYDINTTYKNDTVSCNIINLELSSIFRKKHIIPLFRIENKICNSIWIVKDKKRHYIYYALFRNRKNSYKTRGQNIYTGKNKKVKSIFSEYIIKGRFYNKKLKKVINGKKIFNDYLDIYKKKINRLSWIKLKKMIKKAKKTNFEVPQAGCIGNNRISNRYITSTELNIKQGIFSDSQVEISYDKELIDMKLLIDYIFNLIRK